MSEQLVLDGYNAMLNSVLMVVDPEDDAVRYGLGSKEQVTIDGHKLWLPTERSLDSKAKANDAFFHPLCEDALHGQSEMIHFMTRRVLAALSLRTDELVGSVLTLASDPKKQTKVKNAKAIEFMKVVKDLKDNTLKNWAKLVEKMSEHNGLYSVYLNRNKEVDGVHYSRVCVLEVPILNDQTPGADLCGINVHSKANKELIRALMERIFDGLPLAYGANGNAPYLHCLLKMYRAVSERLNEIVELFKGMLDCTIVRFDWMDEIFGDEDKLAELLGYIPPLSFNTGEEARSAMKSTVEASGRDVESDRPPFDPDPKPSRPKAGLRLDDLDDRDDSIGSRRDRDRRRGRDRDRDRDDDGYERFANDGKRKDDDDDRNRRRSRSRMSDAFDRGGRRDRDRDRRDRRDRDDDRERGSGRGISLDDLD